MFCRVTPSLAIGLFLFGAAMLPPRLARCEARTPVSERVAPGMTADQILAFAERLLNEGEYFRAITEYRRFLFAFPTDPRRAMAHFRVGLAQYRGTRYPDALQTFREVAERYPETVYGRQALLWQGEALMRQADYPQADAVFDRVSRQFEHDDLGHLARYQQGWIRLYQRQWQAAAQQFRQIPASSPLYRAAQHLAEEVQEGDRLAQKSPVLAGVLSGVLPGSGQLYNGRPGDALLAFFLNGLFVVGIIEAVNHDELAIAGALSFFEAGWYAGNVYGAVNGAHKHNRRVVETFIHNLESRFRLEPREARRVLGIRLSFRF